MATKTYSGDFGGIKAGTSGKSITVNHYDPIPNNAIINSVTYTFRITGSPYSSSYRWQLHWFAIGGTDGSPYANSDDATMQSTEHTFSGNLNYTQSDLTKFTSNSFTVYAKANNNGPSNYASYMRAFTITVNYSMPSVTTPSNLTITQNVDGPTFTLDWNDSTGTGGSGSIVYGVYDDTAGGYLRNVDDNPVTSSNYTGNIPAYNSTRKYSIIAKYSGVYSDWSEIKSIIFYKPSINNPSSLTINQTSGQSCKLSWTAASLNYTKGTITYHIYKNGAEIQTTTSTSYTFDESIVSKWGTNTVSLTIQAIATSLKNTASGTSLSSDIIGPVNFTYIPPYKTILYYTGSGPINGYEECIAYYYTGNSNEGNNGWVECEPYIYTGESNATINGWQLCSYT